MIDQDKKWFGGWWLWILLLIIVTSVAGFGLRYAGIFGERIIFENSYQKHSADDARQSGLEAELVGITARLRAGGLTQSQQADLEAQKASVTYQLNRSN